MIDMTKSPINSQAPVASAPKRSLTPRRRAREYALQGVYQSLVVRRAGSLPNGAVISMQLSEDPAFKRCQLDLFNGICTYVEHRVGERRKGDPAYLVANPDKFIKTTGFKYQYKSNDLDLMIKQHWSYRNNVRL
jgi:hypothetical protein